MPRQVEGEPYNRISVDEAVEFHGSDEVAFIDADSYTHLTLPTICSV